MKQMKEKVLVGTDKKGNPIYKWATGYTKKDLHLCIARIITEAGLLGGICFSDAAVGKEGVNGQGVY